MKNVFTLLIFSILGASTCFAQILPNASFENWTGNNYPHPVSWNGTDSSTAIVGVNGTMQKSTDAHTGSFALKSEAKYLSAFSRMVPGLATTGDIDLINELVLNGTPYTLRPDSFAGWYKYTRTFNDTMYAQLVLLDANDDTVGFAEYTNIIDASVYTRFSVAIDYHNSSNPTYGHVILRHATSSAAGGVGSIMLIDDLEVVFPTGVEENAANAKTVKFYPNPAENYLMFENNTGNEIELVVYDAIGKQVLKRTIASQQQKVDITLADGVYIAEMKQDGKAIKLEKLVVQH